MGRLSWYGNSALVPIRHALILVGFGLDFPCEEEFDTEMYNERSADSSNRL